MGPDLRQVRQALGVSLNRMAELLGLQGERAPTTLREIEGGAKPISGQMQRLLAYISQGLYLEASPQDHDLMLAVLPRWLDCTNLEDEDGTEIVMHTRHPRFYALFLEQVESADELPDELDVVEFDADTGLPPAVIVWLDEPVHNTGPLLEELRKLKSAQARKDLK